MSEIHNVGSYYDLISWIWLSNPDVDYKFEHSLHTFKRKPAKKLGKNPKQLNKTNKGNFTYPPHIKVDVHGVLCCMAGHAMINWGYNPDRCRIKYRCPLALGRIESCDCKDKCSPSRYGECIYIKPTWDLRLFTIVPRGSDEWKKQMKTRTTSERVNKHILNGYGLELSRTRGKKRTFWRSVVHSLNILLDARLKLSGFSFMDLLAVRKTSL